MIKGFNSLINVNCFQKKKGGDLSRLANYRIMEYQLKVMPGKFIAYNGMMTQLILEDAREYHDKEYTSIGLCLNQAKAFDGVSLYWPSLVPEHYIFPKMITDCLFNLLYNNKIYVNLNGSLSVNFVPKNCGLKQEDPISCILYNLAIENGHYLCF